MEEEEATSTLWLGNLDPNKVTRRIVYEVAIQVSAGRAELLCDAAAVWNAASAAAGRGCGLAP
jgi:hypothetical protein